MFAFLATDKENKLLMDKVQARVRNDQEIFSSLGDVIRSEEIPVQSKVLSARKILTLVLFIIMSIMMILFLVYQCSFFDQHMLKLKKKNLEQGRVSPKKVSTGTAY